MNIVRRSLNSDSESSVHNSASERTLPAQAPQAGRGGSDTAHLTFYVRDTGYGETDLTVYAHAEAALERCMERAERESVWRFEPDDAPLFEAILRQADRQLDGAPSHLHMDASARLNRFTLSGRRSPLTSAAHMQ
ncbi:hypothetical protein [Caballeronia humi]|uniref:hypothetical protein n=1 Tax=Caballeronia humi TaxID=326474 RepID=UPI000B3E81E4|nr:hypothetical protein [Caballeronia humi]